MNYIKIRTAALLLMASTSHLSATTTTIPETTRGKLALIFETFNDINKKTESMKKADKNKRGALKKEIEASKAEIKKLIKFDETIVDQRNSYDADFDETIIICAAEYGFTDIIKTILKRGADIDAKYNEGDTALMVAVQHIQLSTIELLLYHGADVTIKNEKYRNFTALDLANGLDGSNTKVAIVKLLEAAEKAQLKANEIHQHFNLIDNGVTQEKLRSLRKEITGIIKSDENIINQRDPDHTSDREPLLMRAAEWGFIKVIKMLLDRDVNIDATDSKGYTALMMAAMFYNYKIVRLLLLRKADALLKNNYGETALDLANKDYNDDNDELDEAQVKAKAKIISLLEDAEETQRKEKPAAIPLRLSVHPEAKYETNEDEKQIIPKQTTDNEPIIRKQSSSESGSDDSKEPSTHIPQAVDQDNINTTTSPNITGTQAAAKNDKTTTSINANINITTAHKTQVEDKPSGTTEEEDEDESSSSSVSLTVAQDDGTRSKTATKEEEAKNDFAIHTTFKQKKIPSTISPEIIKQIKANQKISHIIFVIFFLFVLISTPSYFLHSM